MEMIGDTDLTRRIIQCSFKVHNALGPGFHERVYHKALIVAFKEKCIEFDTEKTFNVFYESEKVGQFRLDLLVENKVVVEIKALANAVPIIFHHQVLSYLKISNLKVALLVNFGAKSCQIKRFVN